MNTSRGKLTQQVVLWTLQTLLAGRFLVGLYRNLHDDKQASAALDVMAPSQERAHRLRLDLQGEGPAFQTMGETEAEAKAWEDLLEAQMGFCAFHAMVDGPRGPKQAAERAYRKAIRGFETAFPTEHAAPRCEATLLRVSSLCADLFIQDLGEDGSQEDRKTLHHLIVEGIRTGFAQAEAHPLFRPESVTTVLLPGQRA